MVDLQLIQSKIYEIRGQRVMLDFDLAQMYGTETAQLKRAVRRNKKRFDGEDFMFEVTRDELSRCQIGTLNKSRGSNIKYLPFAFAMLSSVLNSETAIEINKGIMRAAVMIQMTWPGAPTLYYGDGAGLCGFTDPDNRRTYPWGKEDKELIRFHKEMIRIHKENKELLTGSLKFLDGDYNILAYGRFNRHACTAVFLNNNDHEITREIDVWYIGAPKEGVMQCVMLTTADGFDVEVHEYPIVSGFP